MLKVIDIMKAKWVEIDGASFYLRPLSELGKINLVEHGNLNGKKIVFHKQVVEDSISECLLGWKEVEDGDGEVEFSVHAALTSLPMKTLNTIMSHIFTHAFVGDDVEKKS